jgi:peptidoglycan/xylan/chitin deacetylase (PgdA/CDA1 family)
VHALGRLARGSNLLPLAALTLPSARWPLLAVWAAVHAAAAQELLRPGSRALAPNVTRLPSAEDGVALTFDDGPIPEETPRLIDALAEAAVPAAFFVIGRRARAYPDLVKRIAAAGHTIGNHSFTHPKSWSVLGRRRLEAEVADTQALIADLTGVEPTWLRPPMGHKNFHLAAVLERHRLRQVTWSLRSYDTLLRDPGRLLHRILLRIRGGDIVLVHDAPVATRMIAPLVAALRARGLPLAKLRALSPSRNEVS